MFNLCVISQKAKTHCQFIAKDSAVILSLHDSTFSKKYQRYLLVIYHDWNSTNESHRPFHPPLNTVSIYSSRWSNLHRRAKYDLE